MSRRIVAVAPSSPGPVSDGTIVMVTTSMLRPDGDGSRLRVWLVPGARQSRIVGTLGDALKVRVASPAERGRANGELIRMLEHHFGCPVVLVSGFHSRAKEVRLVGMLPGAAARCLPP